MKTDVMLMKRLTGKEYCQVLVMFNNAQRQIFNVIPKSNLMFEINQDLRVIDGYSAHGQCFQDKESKKCYIALNPVSVKARLKNCPQELNNTIVHEILHCFKGCYNHGAKWKEYASLVNEKYGYKIKRCSSGTDKSLKELREKEKGRFKYIVYCSKCNTQWKYKSRCSVVRFAKECTCPVCKNKSLSVKVNKNE